MPTVKTYLHALNVGQFDKKALHRVDIDRVHHLAAQSSTEAQ